VAEVEEEEAEVEEADTEEPDDKESDGDENEGKEYETNDQEADQSEPKTYTVKVDGEEELATLDDLTRDFSGQRKIQKGMKQAAEQRKQAEDAYNGLNQQREQLHQLMQQVQQQGVLAQPVPPTRELLADDPLGYIEAEATYRDEMGAFQAQRQQIAQQHQATQQAQGQAQQAHLQEQMAALVKAIPEFGDKEKSPKIKEMLVKSSESYGYSSEEMSNIVDHRAMLVLNDAMKYRQMMAGKSNVESKLKKARPLIKAGAKKQPDSASKKQAKRMSQLKKSGSVADAAALLFSS
jgi:hypothetical protein